MKFNTKKTLIISFICLILIAEVFLLKEKNNLKLKEKANNKIKSNVANKMKVFEKYRLKSNL